MVIETKPFLEDGTPFPTLFWLSCPYLKEEISKIESGAEKAVITNQVLQDKLALAKELESERLYADYLECQGFGRKLFIGGSKSPLTFKCMHALVAWYLVSHRGIAAAITLGKLESNYCKDKRCEIGHE